jgi:hypothetical protein
MNGYILLKIINQIRTTNTFSFLEPESPWDASFSLERKEA